ncbi:hypothetical protein FRC16_006488, partial [Serendipita sp. 398]
PSSQPVATEGIEPCGIKLTSTARSVPTSRSPSNSSTNGWPFHLSFLPVIALHPQAYDLY